MHVEESPSTRQLSEKQREANRRNALKSTGPSSPRGRAISSQNARKYILLPFENPDLPAQLTARYYGRFIPGNKSERRLVDLVVHTARLRHYCLTLGNHVRRGLKSPAEIQSMAETLISESHRLAMLPHYRIAAECAHRNAIRQLEALRSKAA